MNGIWYYVIAFILIWAVAIIFKDQLTKRGFEIKFPLLMWKTGKLRGFIDYLSTKSPKFWKWYMNIGIVVSFIFMVIMAVSLVYSLTTLLDTPSVTVMVPGVEVPGSPIFIPFIAGLIGLATVIIVHEFAHGILSRVEGINVKSIGLLLFIVLPGAFVEPDGEELNSLNYLSKLRIYVAGSVANLSLAAIALIIMMCLSSFVVPAVFEEDGVTISRLTDDGQAIKYLSEGMVIKEINGHALNGSNSYSQIVKTLKPNDMVNITTDKGSYQFKLESNPNNSSLGYMGIQAKPNQVISDAFDNQFYTPLLWGLLSLGDLLYWIFFLNFAVGTFNLLPIKPLDGGHIFENILSRICSENIYKPIVTFTSIFMGIIIIVSLLYGFVGSFI